MAVAAVFAFALVFPLAGSASADTFGPDAFGYTADTSAGLPFEDISTTGTELTDLTSVDDDTTLVAFPDDFLADRFGGFPFYGTSTFFPTVYSEVFVSSNGLLTFGSGNASFTNQDLTAPSTPAEPAIAPLWEDWITSCGAADTVYAEELGGAFDRRLVIQWNMVSSFSAGCDLADTYSFQVALYQNGNIEFRYQDVQSADAGVDFGASSTVGIRNGAADGAPDNGQVLQISFNAPNITDGESILIRSPFGFGGGTGGGGGGGGGGHHRARTTLTLRGPDSADAGDSITLHGKLKCRRAACKRHATIHILRNGHQIGRATTNADGAYSFQTTMPGAGHASYVAEFSRTRRCRASTSDRLAVH